MNLLSDRIALMLNNLHVDQVVFGGYAGVSKGAVNHWLTGKVKSINGLAAIKLQRKTGYNAEWIMIGEGEMLLSYGEPGHRVNEYRESNVRQLTPRDKKLSRMLDDALERMNEQGFAVLVGRATEIALQFPKTKANPAS